MENQTNQPQFGPPTNQFGNQLQVGPPTEGWTEPKDSVNFEMYYVSLCLLVKF